MKHLPFALGLLFFSGYLTASPQWKPGEFIVVDQLGYREGANKIAMVRRPVVGFDAKPGLPSPHRRILVVSIDSNQAVWEGQLVPWRDGATDELSGDKVFWFDFSTLNKPGRYYILDPKRGDKSHPFTISKAPYEPVLAQATRTFFYQRAGFAKRAEFAGKDWADGASHLGAGQDASARLYNKKDDPKTTRDVQGGWYDAGDYNKYTAWAATNIVHLLRAYTDNPEAFSDRTNIPESGNGIPDILDEIRFGLDWLLRMQTPDGSLLSIVGLDHASPPSKASGPSFYGPPNTIASLNAASAFAYSSFVFEKFPSKDLNRYEKTLALAADRAYKWSVKNPKILFKNNDAEFKSEGLGAGQQEVDDYGRSMARLRASYYLWNLTGEKTYHETFEKLVPSTRLIEWYGPNPYEIDTLNVLAEYQAKPQTDVQTTELIRKTYQAGLNGEEFSQAFATKRDAYLSHMKKDAYHWGSNYVKMAQGLVFTIAAKHGIVSSGSAKLLSNAEEYLHYIHGRNPLGLVYLTNMGQFGATKSLTSIYHTWFAVGSKRWAKVTDTTPGPPPGFMPGGPNKDFRLDACCPANCRSVTALRACQLDMSPPLGQPPAKSYKDYNELWPLNSWEISENSTGYQVYYIRLLSFFVKKHQP
jgi:hypothetical protein